MGREVYVLLVEDSLLFREVAAAFLEERGYAWKSAGNGQQALALLAKQRFDLVLLDIEMPVLGGYLTAVKMREAGLDIPIIAMTGHDSDEERQKCLRSGMNAYVTKPFDKEKLQSTMLALLNVFPAGQPLQPRSREFGMGPEQHTIAPNVTVTDLTHLAQLSKGRKEFFMTMIAIFLEQNRDDMSGLETAIRKADYDTIRLLSHKIATSISFMGLEKHILPQLKEIEQLGEERKNPVRISMLFRDVASVCTKAEEELMAIQDKEQIQ